MTRLFALALTLLLGGCVDTATESTRVELSVAGTDAVAPFEGRNGAMLTLDRADVAFGPLYLCAGFTAGELCDEALAEWTDAVVVDALDPSAVRAGEMNALTGTARSYMYDHGLVSLLTRDEPLVTDAAASLGGASVVLEGRAEVGGQTLPFTVSVPIAQGAEVEQGVPVVRSGESDAIEHALAPDGGSALTVRFDPRPWLASADFAALTEDGACAPTVALVCAGPIEQTCAEDGGVLETRDCGALSQVCVRGRGCVERLELGVDDQVGRALRTGVEAGARPQMEFR